MQRSIGTIPDVPSAHETLSNAVDAVAHMVYDILLGDDTERTCHGVDIVLRAKGFPDRVLNRYRDP